LFKTLDNAFEKAPVVFCPQPDKSCHFVYFSQEMRISDPKSHGAFQTILAHLFGCGASQNSVIRQKDIDTIGRAQPQQISYKRKPFIKLIHHPKPRFVKKSFGDVVTAEVIRVRLKDNFTIPTYSLSCVCCKLVAVSG
jgi:hypothetical protein